MTIITNEAPGGTIFLGLDDNGTSMKLSNNDLDKLQKDLSVLISNAFNRKPHITTNIENGFIRVTIMEQEFYDKPIYSKKVGPKNIYIRQGSTNVKASDEEQRSLFAGASGGGENQLVPGGKELLVEKKVDDYILRTGLKGLKFGDIHTKLEKVKAIRNNKITIFGIIAFGSTESIDTTLNNIYIDFRHFAGSSKVSKDLSKIYLTRKEFHGDIKTQFLESYKFTMSMLPTESFV